MLPKKMIMTLIKFTSSSKYYDIYEMHNIELPYKNKLLSLFHVNTSSLNKTFDGL